MSRDVGARRSRAYLLGMRRALFKGVAALAALGVAACEPTVQAPREPGICWAMAVPQKGTVRFNRLAREADLEHCAARLERVRIQMMAVGTGRNSIVGAYQGRFLFLDPASIKTAKSINGNRYVILSRAGDGRLVVPGALRPVASQP